MDSRISRRLGRLSRQQSGLAPACSRADGSLLAAGGRQYIDFYSGAGTLNYGHRNPALMQRLDDDLRLNGPIGNGARLPSLSCRFREAVEEILLKPRNWHYEKHHAACSGAGALEIALRVARRVKGRRNIISFTQGFQGASGQALAESARAFFHRTAGNSALGNITFMPYDRCFGPDVDTVAYLEQMLDAIARKEDFPAAVVVETVLGQGGVNVLTWHWLQELEALCQRRDMLLILDDTQVGCGRTGRFFSFESSGIHADIIVLSKSLSGLGLPVSLILTDPQLGDCVEIPRVPAAGNTLDEELGLLGATHALEQYWQGSEFSAEILRKESLVRDWLENIVHSYADHQLGVRGRGLIQGVVMPVQGRLAQRVAQKSLEYGLLIEASGPQDEVLKLLPALTIGDDLLIKGLEIIERSLAEVLVSHPVRHRDTGPDAGPESRGGGSY